MTSPTETGLWKLTLLASEAEAVVIERRLGDGDEATADAAPALAVTRFEAGHRLWCVEAYLDAEPAPEVVNRLLDGLRLAEAPRLAPVRPENWVAKVEAMLSPVHVGRFVVHGPHDRGKLSADAVAIEIEAAGAFGTAHHGSTQGCLEAIDGLDPASPPASILDLGTGSGVLAIAAGRRWPKAHILATDIDPVAIAIARDNLALNGIGAVAEAIEADGLDHPRLAGADRFDLALANILADPLTALAPRLAAAVAPGGRLVLSGLLDEQADGVLAAYVVTGCRLIASISRAGWSTLVLERI